jgi:uncharacterized protein YozE (UPF0346 family)
MARPKKGEHRKSKIVTFRLEDAVFNKLKKNHPQVSDYLRKRVTYDVTRKHVKGRWSDKQK